MTKRIQTLALLVAAGSLLALPAIGEAHKTGSQHNHGKAKGKNKNKCVVNKGFVVKGTLAANGYKADDPATPANETSVKITVTGANKHARVSGELADMNATQDGVQVAGGSYTVDSSGTPAERDLFGVRLSGYDGGTTDVPAMGDKVRIVGKIAVTKKKCAQGMSTDARYGDTNIRSVKIIDDTPDTP